MSALQSYRLLVHTVGPLYVVVAFLGRVPLAMSQMGTLLLVSDATGSYAVAGGAAGALAVANALGAPVFGGLADRIGQRPVVLGQSVAGGLGLVLLVAVTHGGGSAPVVIAMSALAGLAIPQIGPLARVRWGPVLTRSAAPDRRRLLDAAFSYEGAADELSFVLGPATVGLLAVLVDPAEALLLAGAVLALFGSAFALHPTAALTRPEPGAPRATGRLLTGVLVTLAIAQLLIGMLFGATQTGSTVLATAEGQAGLAGVIHATLGIGSAIAGLAVAALPERIGYPRRLVVAATGLVVLSTPLLFVQTVGQLVAVIALLGFAVAPYMISTFTMAGQLVDPARVGTAMTLLAGATGVGYALGSSIAGRLADGVAGLAPEGGHTPAFAVTVTATVLALAVALTLQHRTRPTP
ncbi:MFS transporter [Aeromicrobium alkaliterrae]|uniref:MFS transporter n=1 Tax=Aeromicrobium alkaliterrae TaxID=302168 RepID=A0ABP4VZ93_9ACTN